MNIIKKSQIKRFFQKHKKEQSSMLEIKAEKIEELKKIETNLLHKFEKTQLKQKATLEKLKRAYDYSFEIKFFPINKHIF